MVTPSHQDNAWWRLHIIGVIYGPQYAVFRLQDRTYSFDNNCISELFIRGGCGSGDLPRSFEHHIALD
jgi:hypothetical protein